MPLFGVELSSCRILPLLSRTVAFCRMAERNIWSVVVCTLLAMLSHPMFALSVVAHPSSQSFSHATAEAAAPVLVARGYELARHDLYIGRFNPVQPTGELQNDRSADPLVEQHCGELARADLVLVFHPNWWGQPPAILKGWIDRVFRRSSIHQTHRCNGNVTCSGIHLKRCGSVACSSFAE